MHVTGFPAVAEPQDTVTARVCARTVIGWFTVDVPCVGVAESVIVRVTVNEPFVE